MLARFHSSVSLTFAHSTFGCYHSVHRASMLDLTIALKLFLSSTTTVTMTTCAEPTFVPANTTPSCHAAVSTHDSASVSAIQPADDLVPDIACRWVLPVLTSLTVLLAPTPLSPFPPALKEVSNSIFVQQVGIYINILIQLQILLW